MTTQEKAKDLVKKFQTSTDINVGKNLEAKACSLICVDEIINAIDLLESFAARNYKTEGKKYWQQIKKEIESL